MISYIAAFYQQKAASYQQKANFMQILNCKEREQSLFATETIRYSLNIWQKKLKIRVFEAKIFFY